MTNIAVTIRDGVATAKLTGILTTGMVGVPVTFDLGPEWEDLTIIAVIRGNGLIFDRPLLGTRQTTVPYEVLEKVGEHIYIGAEGCSASGDLVIQSNFAKVEETVRQGADPSGDIAIDPTQPIWAELMHEVEDLRENTVDPETLSQHDLDPLAHAPILEQLQSLEAGKLSISDIADDLYSKSSTMALSANMGAYLRERLENELLTVQKNLEAQVKERVKTVNGIAPDENGNVVVAGGSGGNGEDGYSPVANVTQTDTGAVISITDKSGTTTATISNGKTPQKGVDYFTEAEKQEIAEQAAGMVEVPGDSGSDSAGGYEVLIDITTTEAVTEFQSPVMDAATAQKFNYASEVFLYVSVPLDKSDTESTTTGNVTVTVFSNYLMTWFSNIGIIPNPTETWTRDGYIFAKIAPTPQRFAAIPRTSGIEQYVWGIGAKTGYGGIVTKMTGVPDIVSMVSGRSYFKVAGSRSMPAGARLVAGVVK